MATSMKTARIGLSFEESNIENSWFLVDFSRHTTVEDVGNEIKFQYFRSVENDDTVVMRINDFLLPIFGRSVLFRENDIVSVRLEKTVENRNLSSTWKSDNHDKHAFTRSEQKIYCKTDGHCRQIITSQPSSRQPETTHQMSQKRAHSERDINLEHSDSDNKRKLTQHKSEKKKKHRRSSLAQVTIEENQYEEKIKKKSKKKISATSTDANTSTMDGSIILTSAEKDGIVILPKPKKGSKTEISEQNNIAVVNDPDEAGITSDDKFPNEEPENKSGLSENKFSNAEITSMIVSDGDMLTDDSQVKDDSHPDASNDSNRKRKRKRNRKKSNQSTSRSSEYNGIEVDKNESAFYGSLPDKLEPAKYYRQGYRNLHSYQVEPNTHKTFGSDSDPENTEESTQQYNFLCKSRKTSETKLELFDNVIPNGNETSEINSVSGTTWKDTSDCSENNSYSAFHGASETGIANKQLSPNENYIATPFQYAESSSDQNFINEHDSAATIFTNVETSPVQLERKMLTNGVSVFVRQRASHISRFRELSKQEQLNTRSTNVSTVFVNTEEPQFKVPTSPAPRQKPSLKPDVSAVEDPEWTDPAAGHSLGLTPDMSVVESYTASNSLSSIISQLSDGNDCTKWKPLVGMPEPGNMIAYKVLEISVNCTPEVSDYKIGKVLSVGNDQMLEMKHSHQEVHKTKFHVEIEDDDEILTNTRDTSDVVSLHLTSMLEPHIVEQQCE